MDAIPAAPAAVETRMITSKGENDACEGAYRANDSEMGRGGHAAVPPHRPGSVSCHLVLLGDRRRVGRGASRRGALPELDRGHGHSGLTGWNSDPKQPRLDAPQNSWATGANPAVNSIYQRILALNEGIRGHAYNLAVSGSKVGDLVRQANEAAALPVKPELVIIQSIDNDMGCDGTDAQNYRPFGATLARALDILVASNPDVQIFIINQWATAKNFATVARSIPDQRTSLAEDGPCGLLKPSGKLRPAGIASYERILAGYYKQIKLVCARLADCSTDHNALHRMVIQRSDLAPDGGHLSVRGQRRMAAVAWQALY